MDPVLLHRLSGSVRRVAVFRTGIGVGDDEQGAEVYLATGLTQSWARAWPQLRQFS